MNILQILNIMSEFTLDNKPLATSLSIYGNTIDNNVASNSIVNGNNVANIECVGCNIDRNSADYLF